MSENIKQPISQALLVVPARLKSPGAARFAGEKLRIKRFPPTLYFQNGAAELP
jgi:hypothetical protein